MFVAAWLFLPFWLFLCVAAYLYFVPLFQPLIFSVPLAVLLFLTASWPHYLFAAVLLGAAFFLMLGIKDLVLLERRQSYEALVFLLLFLFCFRFFAWFPNWSGQFIFVTPFILAAVFFILVSSFISYERGLTALEQPSGNRRDVALVGVSALLLWQYAQVVLFLPFNSHLQAALSFLAAAFLFEVLICYRRGAAPSFLFPAVASVFFVLTALVLGIARWTL